MNKLLSLGHISTDVFLDKQISASISASTYRESKCVVSDIQIQSKLTDTICESIFSEILETETYHIDVIFEKNVDSQIKILCQELCSFDYSDIFLPRDIYSKIMQYQMSLGTYINSNNSILQGTLPKYGSNVPISLHPINFKTPSYKIVCMMYNSFMYNISVGSSKDTFENTKHIIKFGYNIDFNRVKVIDYIDKYNPEFIQYNRNKKIENLLS